MTSEQIEQAVWLYLMMLSSRFLFSASSSPHQLYFPVSAFRKDDGVEMTKIISLVKSINSHMCWSFLQLMGVLWKPTDKR